MEAEKWRQITSSFGCNSIQKSTQDSVNIHQKEFKTLDGGGDRVPFIEGTKENPSEVLKTHKHNSKHNHYNLSPIYRTRSNQNQSQPVYVDDAEMEAKVKIQVLTKLLEEKSKIIQKQNNVITTLQNKLDNIDKVGGESTQQSNNKDEIRSDAKRALKHNNEMSLKSIPKTQNEDLIKLVIERLETLEKSMNQIIKSLPKKIQTYCENYISRCKFKYDNESGEILISFKKEDTPIIISSNEMDIKKPIWEKSPKIRPKLNNSSQIRTRKAFDNINAPDSNNDNNLSNKMVEDHLNQIERVIKELKISFIQLLVQRVTSSSKKNGGDKNCNSFSSICKLFSNLES